MSTEPIVIKGTWFSFSKLLLLVPLSVGATFMIVYQIVITDLPITDKGLKELVVIGLGTLCLSLIFYWALADEYYYYEVHADRITVRNYFKPYYQELAFQPLVCVNLYGSITDSKMRGNQIQFIYQLNDARKNFRYSSIQLNQADWKRLIQSLKTKQIKVEDPNQFFRYSNSKLEDI